MVATTMPTATVKGRRRQPEAEAAGPFRSIELAYGLGGQSLRWLVAVQVARMAAKLGFLASAASCIGLVVMGGEPSAPLLSSAPLLLLLAAIIGLVADRMALEMEARLSCSMREAATAHLAALPGPEIRSLARGHLTVSLQRYPPALAALAIGHRTATLMMVAGPLMTAAALVAVSWQAALLIMLLTPVMIVFFVLVGDTIRKRAEAQERAFSRLAGQFADRVRTLPTILANHAEAGEQAKLAHRLIAYADRTMGVLRIAFLNAAVIDFFASLSIAMLAVFLGLGHLKLAMIPGFSDIELRQSLFILMLAPEFFAPFRRFSELYHVKAEGLAAGQAWDALLNPAAAEAIGRRWVGPKELLLPQAGLVAIVGPSGSGKSTLLRQLSGVDPSAEPAPLASVAVAWVSTDSYIPGGTVRDALLWGQDAPDETSLQEIGRSLGLLDEGLLPGGLSAPVEDGGANLSGGQRLRLAVARAALSGRAVVADEPTAKLDPSAAAAVRELLTVLARSRLVVVATHDPLLARTADRIIRMETAEHQGAEP